VKHWSETVRWCVLLSAFVFLVTGSAFAQEDEEYVPEDSEAAAGDLGEGDEEGLSLTANRTDFSLIQDLLSRDEEVLSDPGIYSYDPGARRDPFRSLAERRQGPQNDVEEERPEGPAGLLIDEITVEGVFVLPDGPVAQIQSIGQETSFLLRPGDQLWDGDVVSIGLDEVVFKQSVNDPTALKPFREVVKKMVEQ
jgi:hypothetical protein